MLCHYIFNKSSAKRSSVHPYCIHGNPTNMMHSHTVLNLGVIKSLSLGIDLILEPSRSGSFRKRRFGDFHVGFIVHPQRLLLRCETL